MHHLELITLIQKLGFKMSELTTNKLFKLISIENLAAMITVAFVGGITYNTLSASDADAQRRLDALESEQKSISSEVRNIQVSIAIVKNEQTHIRKQLDDQGQDVREVLKILKSTGG